MNRMITIAWVCVMILAAIATCVFAIFGLRDQLDAARAEAADLRAQLAEANEQRVAVVEPPKEMTAVNEAYTPVEPPKQTTTVNGQECELVPASETVGAKYLGTFRVTHYAPVDECCGKSDGISASGRPVIPYYSVAVDPTVIPLGTILKMDYGDGVMHEVRADDTGKLVKGYTIDLCVPDYATAVQMGVRSATVYVGGRGNEN